MLTVETIGRIRREHFLKGKTIKEIVRDLKVSRNTVRKVLRSGATSFEYERNVQPRRKLGRWSDGTNPTLRSHGRAQALRHEGGLRGGHGHGSQTPARASTRRRRPAQGRDQREAGALDQVPTHHRQAAAGQRP